MSLTNKEWRISYTSYGNDVLEEFYKPAINNSISYKRITGYFNPEFLKKLAYEIKMASDFNNLSIKILCSPEMNNQDIEDIQLGYSIKDKIEYRIVQMIEEISDENEDLPFIAYLIVKNILDIKFVIPQKRLGMFHDKKGVFSDSDGNKIAFTGSNNETINAVMNNYESFTVFTNWENKKYTDEVEMDFDNIWEEKNDQLIVLQCTSNIKEAFEKRYTQHKEKQKPTNYSKINIRQKYNLYDYQEEAVNRWQNNNYKGLLEMATGTGKTITALACYQALTDEVSKMITIVVVPQIELLHQWEKDLKNGGVKSVLCSGDNPKWKQDLQSRIRLLNTKPEGYVNVVVTRNTFISGNFKEIINRYSEIPKLLIADEVHSFGSTTTRKLYSQLEEIFKYRLGISATPFRKSETESEELINLFNGIVFSYALKQAIDSGFLNRYEYKPMLLHFDTETLAQYRKDINDNLNIIKKNDAIALSTVENLTSTIANSSTAKVQKLIEMANEKDDTIQSIIYCSPGGYNDGYKKYDERHIYYSAKLLGEAGLRLRIIKSDVDSGQRKEILNQFKNKDINTLLAIKCLDQGINLPEVSEAYILSSTDSLTEFIQRRGRILRTYEGKPTSQIYDFIMLPQDFKSAAFDPDEADGYLVAREIRRMKAYNDASENNEEIKVLINQIESAYAEVLEMEEVK